MFLDASAIVAIIAQEDDWPALAARIEAADEIYVSPLSLWEATTGLMRQAQISAEAAKYLVGLFVKESGALVMPISEEIGAAAFEAFAAFGKGRHPAKLNLGDCFAYACAKSRNIAILYKGNDFRLTDLA